MEAMGAKIAAAIVSATQAAQAVTKASVNQFDRYKYASAESIISEAREALTSAGLAVVTNGWSVGWPSEGDERPAHLVVRYRLVHVSGETFDPDPCETAIIPIKGRPYDKAEATALTYSLAYFLRGLLLLPRVDEDAEVDRRDDRDSSNGVADSLPTPGDARSWEERTAEYVRRLESARTDQDISVIAGEVHRSKPPKKHRDLIAEAYQRAVSRCAPRQQGAAS